LFRSLDPTFKVATAQRTILGLVRQKNGAVVQRKTDLLPGQQICKQTDAGLIVRQWNNELFLESAANGSVDSLKVIAGGYKENMTVAGADTVHLLEQLADNLIRQLVIAARRRAIRCNNVQLVQEQDCRRTGPCALEEQFHPIAALAEIVRLHIGRGGRNKCRSPSGKDILFSVHS